MHPAWPSRIEYIKDLVVERPLEHAPVACPYCNSSDVTETSHEQTLLGGLAGQDPNHHWRSHVCNSCKKTFCYQHKDNLGWYTAVRNGRLLKGVAGCFESEKYTCAHCGGSVELDVGHAVRAYRIPALRPVRDPYKCLGCGRSTPADDGGYDEKTAEHQRQQFTVGWRAYEEMGPCFAHPDAIKELRLSGDGK